MPRVANIFYLVCYPTIVIYFVDVIESMADQVPPELSKFLQSCYGDRFGWVHVDDAITDDTDDSQSALCDGPPAAGVILHFSAFAFVSALLLIRLSI